MERDGWDEQKKGKKEKIPTEETADFYTGIFSSDAWRLVFPFGKAVR